MLSTEPEMIWRDRVHFGDEPGVRPDAFYGGLPLTLQTTNATGPDTTTVSVRTADLISQSLIFVASLGFRM